MLVVDRRQQSAERSTDIPIDLMHQSLTIHTAVTTLKTLSLPDFSPSHPFVLGFGVLGFGVWHEGSAQFGGVKVCMQLVLG